jgi:hypothetical protein
MGLSNLDNEAKWFYTADQTLITNRLQNKLDPLYTFFKITMNQDFCLGVKLIWIFSSK